MPKFSEAGKAMGGEGGKPTPDGAWSAISGMLGGKKKKTGGMSELLGTIGATVGGDRDMRARYRAEHRPTGVIGDMLGRLGKKLGWELPDRPSYDDWLASQYKTTSSPYSQTPSSHGTPLPGTPQYKASSPVDVLPTKKPDEAERRLAQLHAARKMMGT